MPNAILHREGGILSAQIILEGNRLRLAARINSLDDRHPLRSRASICPSGGTLKYKKTHRISRRPEIQISQIQRAYRQLILSSEVAEPLKAPTYTFKLGIKSEGLEAHKKWAQSTSFPDICGYSDGSSEGHGRSAWGFVLQRGGVTFQKGKGILHGGEVYDAVILGASMALFAVVTTRRPGKKIFVLLDNQSAVGALQSGKTSSCI